MKRITVYCASSSQINPIYFDTTAHLARLLVEHDYEVVFGGGSTGLMGKLADTVLEAGGRIKGIMPRFMHEVEWSHKGVTYFEYTDTMHERKAGLIRDTDGVVALPGGCGTFEELLEAITLKRLGLYNKPIVILNTAGFYDPLETLLERSIEEQFMKPIHRDMWRFVRKPEQVLEVLQNPVPWMLDSLEDARSK
jgi:uncharacterized protein (TIGR00730 family)